jgi:hypothetical protein
MAVSIDRVEPPLAQPRPDPALDTIVAQAQLLQAQLEAEAHARVGRYQQATATLYQRAVDLDARGHGAVSAAARTLADKMKDTDSYDQSGPMRKSMQSAMKRAAASGMEGEAEELARRMGKKTRTKAQEDMFASFREPPPVSPADTKDPSSARPATGPQPEALKALVNRPPGPNPARIFRGEPCIVRDSSELIPRSWPGCQSLRDGHLS